MPLLATATHATRTQTRLTHVTDRPETFKQQPGQPPSRSWQAETHLCAFRGFERSGSRSVRTGSCAATLPRVASTVGISAHVLPTPTRQSSPFPRFQPHLPLDPVPRPYLLMELVPNQSSSTHPYPISPIRTDPWNTRDPRTQPFLPNPLTCGLEPLQRRIAPLPLDTTSYPTNPYLPTATTRIHSLRSLSTQSYPKLSSCR